MNTRAPEIQMPRFELQIAGKPWKEVESFDGLGTDEQVFIFDRNTGRVIFGDGVHGARPPVGSNLKATYRAGGGTENADYSDSVSFEISWPQSLENRVIGAACEPADDGFVFRTCGLFESDGNRCLEIADMLCAKLESPAKLTLSDLVLSVLPWPFHKELPKQAKAFCRDHGKTRWSLFLYSICSRFGNSLTTMNDEQAETSQNKIFINPKYRSYTVKDGDDLREICTQVYGSSVYSLEIARVNNLRNFRRLSAGTRLVFPPLEKKDE